MYLKKFQLILKKKIQLCKWHWRSYLMKKIHSSPNQESSLRYPCFMLGTTTQRHASTMRGRPHLNTFTTVRLSQTVKKNHYVC